MQLDEDQERTVYSASLRVGELVERIKALLGNAGHDIEQYGHALGSFNDSLGRHGRPENLRALVAELVLETGRMAERNKALEVQLSHASDEMTNLRQNLVSVRKEALTDPLTKIANRKCFDDTLREAASHSLGAGEPLSLLMLDIDHFKIFNDRFGHQVGDEVLRVVARTLVRSVKGQDLPARYGGEEFAIILPSTYLEDAATLAGQIRAKIATKHIVRKITGQDFGIVTLSIGVAQYRLGERLADFIRRADEALYAAKRDGRDRVAVARALDDAVEAEGSVSRG
jgi:diguanylate cyclase